MATLVITTVEKSGRDIVINDAYSIPKDKILISKRVEGLCTLAFDQKYYSEVYGFHVDQVEVFWQNVTKPSGVTDNETLFDKLVQLKTP